jgi:hypothetical protein
MINEILTCHDAMSSYRRLNMLTLARISLNKDISYINVKALIISE